jgi:putative hemolysin
MAAEPCFVTLWRKDQMEAATALATLRGRLQELQRQHEAALAEADDHHFRVRAGVAKARMKDHIRECGLCRKGGGKHCEDFQYLRRVTKRPGEKPRPHRRLPLSSSSSSSSSSSPLSPSSPAAISPAPVEEINAQAGSEQQQQQNPQPEPQQEQPQQQEAQTDQATAAATSSEADSAELSAAVAATDISPYSAAINAAVSSSHRPDERVGMRRKSDHDHGIREEYYQPRWRVYVPEPACAGSSADERTTGRKLRGVVLMRHMADPTKRHVHDLYEDEADEYQPCKIEGKPRKLVRTKGPCVDGKRAGRSRQRRGNYGGERVMTNGRGKLCM